MGVSDGTLARIADEVFDTMATPREVKPFSERFPEFDLEDAYIVVNEIRRRREARGERVVGRKIGFTNSAAWSGYGISGPIWNYLYDTTTRDLTAGTSYRVANWPNIRMETEVALGLCDAPDAGMDDSELLNCIEWAALDFEICASIYSEWRFSDACRRSASRGSSCGRPGNLHRSRSKKAIASIRNELKIRRKKFRGSSNPPARTNNTYGSRPMRPAAGDPLQPSGRVAGATGALSLVE
jgi:2-keto-4-pentenoate hydratase